MHDQIVPRLAKWPFFLGDALMLGLAAYVCSQSKLPLGQFELLIVVVCTALGAALGVLPFLSEYRAMVQNSQAESLATATAQIQNLGQVATQISSATSQWLTAQEAADQTTRAAKQIANGMSGELKTFGDLMARSSDAEKAALRLEAEKARRSESEWLQLVVHLLDHTFALHGAAVRSGQAGVIRQMDLFQNACRDAARRVGLVPFLAAPGENFDPQRHQLAEAESKPPAGAVVAETVAAGYNFQNQLLRPAIVRLQESQVVLPQLDQNQLPLEAAKAD